MSTLGEQLIPPAREFNKRIKAIHDVLVAGEVCIENIFDLGDFSDQTKNGLQIKRLSNTQFLVNGTATQTFNVNVSWHGYDVPASTETFHKVITNADAFPSGCYFQLGVFNTDGTLYQQPKIQAPDTWVSFKYSDKAKDSREYFVITNGAVFDNQTFEFVTAISTHTIAEKVDSLGDEVDSLGDEVDSIKDYDLPTVLKSLQLDLNTNKYVCTQPSLNNNGIAISRLNASQIKITGTTTAAFNLVTEKTVDLDFHKSLKLYMKCNEGHTVDDLYIQTGYFDEENTVKQLSTKVPPNEVTELTFPEAAKIGRFYVHLNSGVSFDDEVITFYAYYDIDTNEEPAEVLKANLSGNSFNSAYHENGAAYVDACTRFSSLMSGDTINGVQAVKDAEAFLFFTDPHTQHAPWSKHFNEYMGQIQKVYRSTPCAFVLCGGDWLGNSDVPATASYKMGLIGATCKSMLEPCYMLVGNHDTNYHGKKDSESSTYTTRFPNESISNFWYNGKTAYYTFDGMKTRFYCFDTGIENQALSALDNYGTKQVEWFAKALQIDNSEHIALAMHIYYQDSLNPISQSVMEIAAAYNSRTSISFNETEYDYSNATGFIEFVIAGHSHMDELYRYTEGGVDIPVIVTLDTGNKTTFPADASFDLVFVDYDHRNISCIRVGHGEDRSVVLAEIN